MKRVFALLLTVIMVMTLAACGGKAGSQNTETEKVFVPLFIDSVDGKYAEAIKAGAEDAAIDLNAEVVLCGPSKDVEGDFATLAKAEMAKKPSAVAIASTVVKDAADIISECSSKDIPVIGFGMGAVADASFNANVYTDVSDAASLAARKITSNYVTLTALRTATPEQPAVIACVASQNNADVISSFVNTISEQSEAIQPGKVSIEGHEDWANKIENASVIIRVAIAEDTSPNAISNVVIENLEMDNLDTFFCVDTNILSTLLSLTNKGADLATRYPSVKAVSLYDGYTHKSAIRQGYLYGTVLNDQYQIGYKAVETAVKAALDEEISDVEVDFTWVDSVNLLDDEIMLMLYD